MPKVFTGKIVIPGSKINDYLNALAGADRETQPFRDYLSNLNKAFEEHLLSTRSPRTANKHTTIIGLFIDFLCYNTDVRRIEDITKGIANSYFRRWYTSKVGDCTESELKTAVKKFFQFLANERGIVNEQVLESFKR